MGQRSLVTQGIPATERAGEQGSSRSSMQSRLFIRAASPPKLEISLNLKSRNDRRHRPRLKSGLTRWLRRGDRVGWLKMGRTIRWMKKERENGEIIVKSLVTGPGYFKGTEVMKRPLQERCANTDIQGLRTSRGDGGV